MAALTRLVVLAAACACATAQYAEERAPRYIASESAKPAPPPPVAILKQINRHNEDGSYTYGYESADGSFKIETKSPAGEVKGKYGYKDETGKLRVVEYGANKYGFQPAGEGITVAPPTLVDDSKDEGRRPGKSQSGRNTAVQQQAVDYDYEEPAPAPRPRPTQQQQQQQYRPPQQQQQQQYRPPQQQYRPQQQAAPAPPKPAFFSGAAPAPLESDNLFNPAPRQQQQHRPKQDFRPAPNFQNFPKPQVEYTQNFNPEPAQPRFAQEPRFSPAPQQFSQQRDQPFSMLDQLLKEYSLPPGGSAPTHDITFGSY